MGHKMQTLWGRLLPPLASTLLHQVSSSAEQNVTAWARVFANWGHSESNEINREHKKVKRSPWGSLPNGTGASASVPQQKALKNLRRKSNSNVSGLWAEVSWRNKSFSQQSQREITGHSIGMHSEHFYVPKGSFLIFWTRLGSKYCGKVCVI